MLPNLFKYEEKILLLSANEAIFLDAKNKYKAIARSMFPANVLKATQSGCSVVITTVKNEQYMIDFLTAETKLSNGTLFFESRPKPTDACLYAKISGSAAHEKIPSVNLSNESAYGNISIAEMKGAASASEDAFLLTYSEWELFFWKPVHPLPMIMPDYEVIKKIESIAPIKKAEIDAAGKKAIMLTNTGILTLMSCSSDPENSVISDTCCDFVLNGNDVVFATPDQTRIFNIEDQTSLDPKEE